MTWLSKGFRGSKRIRWIGTKNMKRVVNGKQDETTKIPISFCNGFATCKITLSIAIYKIGLEKSFDLYSETGYYHEHWDKVGGRGVVLR